MNRRPFLRHPVEVRGLDRLRAEAAEVVVALVVGEDDDEVRLGGRGSGGGRQGQRGGEREEGGKDGFHAWEVTGEVGRMFQGGTGCGGQGMMLWAPRAARGEGALMQGGPWILAAGCRRNGLRRDAAATVQGRRRNGAGTQPVRKRTRENLAILPCGSG